MDLPSRSTDPSNPGVTPDLPTERSRSSAGSPAERSRSPVATTPLSRYESQKRRDWNTFLQYLKTHKPPLMLSRCSGAHVIEFLKYLDQFGKTKVHATGCSFFGHPNPPAPCTCPLKQAWGSLDALIGRLRAAYEENGGRPESNPFGARAVRIYLREVKDSQAKARGVPYEKKKRKRAGSSSAATATDTSMAVDEGGGVTDDGGTGGVISSRSFEEFNFKWPNQACHNQSFCLICVRRHTGDPMDSPILYNMFLIRGTFNNNFPFESLI